MIAEYSITIEEDHKRTGKLHNESKRIIHAMICHNNDSP